MDNAGWGNTRARNDGGMEFVLTVVDPRGPATRDLEVRAPVGTTFGSVRETIFRTSERRAVFCGAQPVPDDAVLGLPPLLHGAVLTLDRASQPPAHGMLELHVRSGPDSGAVHRLAPGEHAIGRSAQARVRLDDPDVSRLHALLRVGLDGADRTTVQDLRSTNGTWVDGAPVGPGGAPLRPGQVLQVGACGLELVVPDGRRASCRPDGGGYLELNRPPRHLPARATARVTLPPAPLAREPSGFPVLAAVVPVVGGLAMAAVLRSPTYLLFLLLSPLMLLGTHGSERSVTRRANRQQDAAHALALARARSRIADALADERAARHRQSPDAATLLATARTPTPDLWLRRRADPDFLVLRIGLGDVPSAVEVRRPATDGASEEVERPLLERVPVTVSLRDAGVLGLAGTPARTMALARSLLAQLAGWHSPRHVSLVILGADCSTAWAWVRWLPHLRPDPAPQTFAAVAADDAQRRTRVAELIALLESRRDRQDGDARVRWDGPVTVVVLDGAESLRRLPGVRRLLVEGPATGIVAICREGERVALPVECRTTVELCGDRPARVHDHDGATYDDVRVDAVALGWAQDFARALAPLRDSTPEEAGEGLPDRARLVDLLRDLPGDQPWHPPGDAGTGPAGLPSGPALDAGCPGVDATSAAALEAAWRARPSSTRVLLGVGAGGRTFSVDLVRDGPHVLVAGTTGAGKSELLQTLVTALAVGNRPDLMSFVLIDYKGGAAFRDCARLPHTVGTVTDLDGHLTARALTSLTAELRRRERLLLAAGFDSLDSYAAAASTDSPPLARLVLVVDEFATLAEELPDFLNGLVGIAQRGRSLGVHLVLATQRPGGVVSADIRANTALRIALRVTDPAESADVVDVRDAAEIPPGLPGRAVVRTGSGSVCVMQTAHVGGRGARPPDQVEVRELSGERVGAPSPPPPAAEAPGATDLQAVVAAAVEAASRLGAVPAASPWLPPLPDLLPLTDLAHTDLAHTDLAHTDRAGSGPARESVEVGQRDRPGEQCQPAFTFDLTGGSHLLVAGGPRSGRTTALRSVAAAIARSFGPGDVHVYALDCAGGGLTDLAHLPHTGAVVGRDEPERGDRLLRRLSDLVSHRQRLLASCGLGCLEEQRAAVTADERMPWVVLLVDGWEAMQHTYDEVDHGRPLETFSRLVREGVAAGVRVILTGDRALLTSRVTSGFGRRLVLRLGDPGDYGLAGIPPRLVPRHLPPGRGVLTPEGEEVQVAVITSGTAESGGSAERGGGAEQARGLSDLAVAAAARWTADLPARRRPLRVAPLPSQVDLDEVAAATACLDLAPAWALVGVGGDEAGPVGIDLALDGPAFVVAGPPGSGRSTTLVSLARWLLHRGRDVAVVASRRSPLRSLARPPGVRGCLGGGDAGELMALLAAHPDLVVLADDIETLQDTPVEGVLLGMLRPDADTTGALVVAGLAAELGASYRGIAVEARRGATGLLLGTAAPGDGDLLGVRLPRTATGPPGRGVLVVRGRATPVQVAWSPLPGGDPTVTVVTAGPAAQVSVSMAPSRTAPATTPECSPTTMPP